MKDREEAEGARWRDRGTERKRGGGAERETGRGGRERQADREGQGRERGPRMRGGGAERPSSFL